MIQFLKNIQTMLVVKNLKIVKMYRPRCPNASVTFLSKTTVDLITEIVESLMKTAISENIRMTTFFYDTNCL